MNSINKLNEVDGVDTKTVAFTDLPCTVYESPLDLEPNDDYFTSKSTHKVGVKLFHFEQISNNFNFLLW